VSPQSPAAPRKVGRCPSCRWVFALTAHGLLVRHGWARIGQAQDGPCPGSGLEPLPPKATS
jgi:hypothetical protein